MLKSLYRRHNQVFLESLRRTREAASLRQADLADRLGSDQATVSKVESGDRRLDVIELREWLLALEVNFVEFVHQLDERLRAHAPIQPRPRTRAPRRPRANSEK